MNIYSMNVVERTVTLYMTLIGKLKEERWSALVGSISTYAKPETTIKIQDVYTREVFEIYLGAE